VKRKRSIRSDPQKNPYVRRTKRHPSCRTPRPARSINIARPKKSATCTLTAGGTAKCGCTHVPRSTSCDAHREHKAFEKLGVPTPKQTKPLISRVGIKNRRHQQNELNEHDTRVTRFTSIQNNQPPPNQAGEDHRASTAEKRRCGEKDTGTQDRRTSDDGEKHGKPQTRKDTTKYQSRESPNGHWKRERQREEAHASVAEDAPISATEGGDDEIV